MMIKFFKRRLSVPCALLLALLVIAPAYAQPEDYTENESLGFGQFGIIDNSVQYSLTVDFNSNVSHDPEFVLLAQPSRAEFFLNDLTPSVPFNVTLTPGTLSLNGLGQPPVFTVTNFTTNGPFNTTGGGTLLVRVGASLLTSGSGAAYPSGSYSGSYDITFDY